MNVLATNTLILALIVILAVIFWFITCAGCAAVGFYIAKRQNKPIIRAEPPAISEKEKMEAETFQKDIDELLSYTGKSKSSGING